MIKMQKVANSSQLEEIGYDKDTKALEIKFKNTINHYLYYNVPEQLYEELMLVKGKGKFFHQFIAKAFKYTKLPVVKNDRATGTTE